MEVACEVVFLRNEVDDYILYSSNGSFWIGARSENEGHFKQEFKLEEILNLNPTYVPFIKAVPKILSKAEYNEQLVRNLAKYNKMSVDEVREYMP